jgi:hypothetical protein
MSRSLESVKKSIGSLSTGLKVLGAAFAVRELGDFIKSNLEFVASIGVTAKQVGVTATQLQVYRFAALMAGLANEDLEIGLRKLTLSTGQAALGASKQTKVLEALHLQLKNADGSSVSTSKRLEELADRLSKTSDAGKRAAVEVALFGKAGQRLDPILTKGAAGLRELGKEAQDAGLIIQDNLIEQAHHASVEIGILDAQLKVSVAKEVAENASAIYGLAGALIKVTSAGLSLVSNYPRIASALAGAAVGARFGGLPGAVIGAAGGAIAGKKLADANTDPKFRASELRASLSNLREARTLYHAQPNARHKGNLEAAIANSQYQTGLASSARNARAVGETQNQPNIDIPSFLGGGGGRPKRAPQDRTNQNLKAYQDQSDNLDRQVLQAKRANLYDVQAIAETNRQEVAVETDKLLKDLSIDAAKNPILAAHKDELAAKIKQVQTEKLKTIKTEEADRLSLELINLQLAANDNEKTLLHAQDQLADTAKERNRIQTRILQLDREDEELKLRDTIAHSHDAAAAEAARVRLAALPQIYGALQQGVDRSTEGPGKAYLRSVTLSKDQLKESIESIKVAGLQNLNEGITQAILGAKSLGAVFKNVANSIIADLLRIAVQKYITNAIAGALFGNGGGGSSGGGIGSSIFGIFKSAANVSSSAKFAKIPGHADGTSSTAPGFAIVGERGPELVRFSGGQQVIPNHLLGGGGTHISVEASPYFDVRVNGHITQAAPIIASAGADIGMARSAYRQGRRVA